MAITMDTQIPHQDDLNHDTLMGLQELDSHLSVFESSNLGRESSTPCSMSNSAFEEAIRTAERPSNIIVVDSPGPEYTPNDQSDVDNHNAAAGNESIFESITVYVYSSYNVIQASTLKLDGPEDWKNIY